MVEKIPLVPQIGKLVTRSIGGRSGSVQGKPLLSGWAKAQAMMLYAQDHEERWVHNGFLQASRPCKSCVRMSGIRSGGPQGELMLSGQAKAQAMMLYVQDHEER